MSQISIASKTPTWAACFQGLKSVGAEKSDDHFQDFVGTKCVEVIAKMPCWAARPFTNAGPLICPVDLTFPRSCSRFHVDGWWSRGPIRRFRRGCDHSRSRHWRWCPACTSLCRAMGGTPSFTHSGIEPLRDRRHDQKRQARFFDPSQSEALADGLALAVPSRRTARTSQPDGPISQNRVGSDSGELTLGRLDLSTRASVYMRQGATREAGRQQAHPKDCNRVNDPARSAVEGRVARVGGSPIRRPNFSPTPKASRETKLTISSGPPSGQVSERLC
jgi:hypothetical protein